MYKRVREREALHLIGTGRWRIISVDGPLYDQWFLLELVCSECGG